MYEEKQAIYVMMILKKGCVNFTYNVLYALKDVRYLATSETPISIIIN